MINNSGFNVDTDGDFKTLTISGPLNLSELLQHLDAELLIVKPARSNYEFCQHLAFPELNSYTLIGSDQAAFAAIDDATWSQLHKFAVVGSPNAFEGMRGNEGLANLKALVVRDQPVTPQGLNWICNQHSITSLSLTDTNVTDALLCHLKSNRSLRTLKLWRTAVRFEDTCLAATSYPAVESLDISGLRLGTSAIERVVNMFPNVKRLIVENTSLVKDSLERLSRIKSLECFSSSTDCLDFGLSRRLFWE